MYCVVLCLIVFGCQYQCNWLPGKTRLWNDLLCVEWDVKPYTLTHSLSTTTTRIEKIWRSDCLKLQRNYLVGHSIVYFVAWATVSALHALFVLFRTLLVATVLQCPVGQIKLLIDWLVRQVVRVVSMPVSIKDEISIEYLTPWCDPVRHVHLLDCCIVVSIVTRVSVLEWRLTVTKSLTIPYRKFIFFVTVITLAICQSDVVPNSSSAIIANGVTVQIMSVTEPADSGWYKPCTSHAWVLSLPCFISNWHVDLHPYIDVCAMWSKMSASIRCRWKKFHSYMLMRFHLFLPV